MNQYAYDNLPPLGAILTIGNFDGMHLGHQSILNMVLEEAHKVGTSSLMITFDPHPKRVLGKDPDLCLITSLEHKLNLLEESGIDGVWIIPFDRKFSNQTPIEFMEKLLFQNIKFKALIVGDQYYFGHKRKGNIALLGELSKKLGFRLILATPVKHGDQYVSSSRIRELIKTGDLDQVSVMLGRSFSIRGVVESGRGIGRTLGFPTANLNTNHELLPPRGVYIVEVKIVDGTVHKGLVNIGIRPTVAEHNSTAAIEVHLLDFKDELRDKSIEVYFKKKVREERRFKSRESLQDQIVKDVKEAHDFFLA